eukprot:CAMPEP_0197025408 /NCGR_PEP_ID=MMETSP1384-20130603/5762_1 /TAXON_ID=29189 /ORGANISM="Ammonia sp." /LENGTH=423 /DNA_ID=CAMNT_0042453935 /DNA_START=116 /DNA_END=1387 /DNA_ORIENTATION=-
MAVALTSFVQPMLLGDQSSESMKTGSRSEDTNTQNLDSLTLDPMIGDVNPSPSPSPTQSPSSQSPSCTTSAISLPNQARTHSIPYSDVGEIDFNALNEDIQCTKAAQTQHAKHRPADTLVELDDIHIDLVGNRAENELEESFTPKACGAVEADRESLHSPSQNKEYSVSTCRYCYADIERKMSVSQCHCSGVLCRECLIKELKLTHGRADSCLQCTVCKREYDVKTEFSFNLQRDCKSLCSHFLIHCGLKDEQYLLDSAGGKIGFFLVILGINTWILSTSLLFAFPPNGCPIELYYMVSVFDFAVGVSTIWFIIKCRYLSPLFLSIMYFVRFLYIILGWLPSINLLNIHRYHDAESNHVSILAYFSIFSLVASLIMCLCWIIDFRAQYGKYRKENGTLILEKNGIKIEINDIVRASNYEADSF